MSSSIITFLAISGIGTFSGVSASATPALPSLSNVPSSGTPIAHNLGVSRFTAPRYARFIPDSSPSNSSAQLLTDSSDYPLDSVITIYGTGFNSSVNVSLTVMNPDNSTNSWITLSNGTGAFTTTYSLTNLLGSYGINATDGSNNAGTSFATFVDPSLSPNPTSGPAGSSLAVFGSGFAAFSIIEIMFNGSVQMTTPDTITSDFSGSFNANITVPATTLGNQVVEALDEQGDNASSIFIVTNSSASGPMIWTDEPVYPPESLVTIYGTGFNANSTIALTVTLPNSHTFSWNTTTNSAGGFTTTYQLDSITGHYSVTATDGTNSASTTFEDAAALVQSEPLCTDETTTTCSHAFGSSVTAGHDLVVAIAAQVASTTCVTVSSVSDTFGDVFTSINAEPASGSARCAYTSVYYSTATETGSDTITVTFSGAPTSGAAEAYELSGAAAVPTSVVGDCTTGTCGTPMTTSSLAISGNSFLAAVGEISYATGFHTIGSPTGFTTSITSGFGDPETVSYDLPTTAGTQTFSMVVADTGSTSDWSDTGAQFASGTVPRPLSVVPRLQLRRGLLHHAQPPLHHLLPREPFIGLPARRQMLRSVLQLALYRPVPAQ